MSDIYEFKRKHLGVCVCTRMCLARENSTVSACDIKRSALLTYGVSIGSSWENTLEAHTAHFEKLLASSVFEKIIY